MNMIYSLEKLKDFIEKENFKGFDPYDALSSPILKALSFNQRYLRIAFIQILKRLPFNIRPFLLIKKNYNPKGIGLFLWGYAKLYKVEGKREYLEKINFFLELLEKIKSRGYSGNCWGYNFDWQSRAFYVPKYTPTIVNSSFIGHALIDTYRYTGNKQALEMAIPIKDFILKDLNRKNENGTICFSYTPVDHTAVHNANLLGASFLIRLYRYTSDPEVKDTALASFAYSLKYQKEDGSWYYAESDYQRWIDSFHTGFNLQSILYFLEEGFGKEHIDAFVKGVNFYSEKFFLENGIPKYYYNKVYPIDIHSAAQAIVFFSKLLNLLKSNKLQNNLAFNVRFYSSLTIKIIRWVIKNMQDKNGYFYFQKKKYYTIKIPYIRWAQAWAFHALTEYNLYIKTSVHDAD